MEKKNSGEKILDRTNKKLPNDNEQFYVKHRVGINTFIVKQDKKQQEKTTYFKQFQIQIKKTPLSKKSTIKKI